MGYQYEFSEAENGTIAYTGGKARTWGIIALVAGGFCLAILAAGLFFLQTNTVISDSDGNTVSSLLLTTLLPLGFVNIVMGNFYIKAGKALSSVVETSGNDIDHMMEALSMFRNAFRVEVLVSAVVFVLSFAAGFMMAAAG